MKVLITGAAGFIGSNLAKTLLEQQHQVFCVDNFITGSQQNIDLLTEDKKFQFFKGNVEDFDFSSLGKVDLIFHLASPASPVQYIKHPVQTMTANSQGTKNLLDSMLKTKSNRFVLASTSEIYGNPQVHPQPEDYWGNVSPNGERSCYDESKRFAEALTMTYFRLHDLDVRIARIFNTYGPNMEKDDGRVISNFICQSLAGEPITVYGDGSQTRSFCFVSDMVAGLTFLGMKDALKGEVVNLGNPDERTILDIAKLIKQETGAKSKIVFKPKGKDDPERRKPNITKAKKLLDWEPKIPLKEGLDETIEYFRSRFFS